MQDYRIELLASQAFFNCLICLICLSWSWASFDAYLQKIVYYWSLFLQMALVSSWNNNNCYNWLVHIISTNENVSFRKRKKWPLWYKIQILTTENDWWLQFEVQTTGAQLPRGPQGNMIDPELLELKLISKVFKFSRVFKLSKLVKLFSKLSKLFSEFIFKLFSSVPELVAVTR